MSEGIREIDFTINCDSVQEDLNRLLRILYDMRTTSIIHEADSIEEWRKVSAKFDSLMEEAEAMAVKKEKLEELSALEPSLKRKYMEDDLNMRNLLKHRERMHMKELISNRDSIKSLINDEIKLAESFKNCISILCKERDYFIQGLNEEIEDLQGQLRKAKASTSTLSASINMVSFGEAMGKAWKEWDEDPNSDKDHPVIQFEFDANGNPSSDWDDEYRFDFLKSAETVDRHEGTVDRHSADWNSSDDEVELLKFIRVWGLESDTPATPRQVITKVPVLEDHQEEEGKLQPEKIIAKDSTMEAIFMDCIVDTIGKPLGLCLIDTGASASIASMETIDRLGLSYTKGDIGQVELTGGGKMGMQGVAEDVRLRIGDAIVIIDLYIVDIGEDSIAKTILGAGFLRAVGAVIDYDARRLSFNKIDPNKFYEWVDISSEFN